MDEIRTNDEHDTDKIRHTYELIPDSVRTKYLKQYGHNIIKIEIQTKYARHTTHIDKIRTKYSQHTDTMQKTYRQHVWNRFFIAA